MVMASQPTESGVSTRLQDARYAVRRTWKASPRGCLLLVAVSLLSSAIPAGTAFTFGGLVGAVETGQSSTGASSGPTVWLMATLSLLLAAVICRILISCISTALGRALELQISSDVLLHASALDQEFFEDPKCQEQLARARQQPGKTCFNFVVSSVQGATGALQSVSVFGMLFWIDWVCGLLLASLCIPTLLIHRRLTHLRYSAERNKTSKHRWIGYYLKTCTAHLKTPTLKVFGLYPLMVQRFSGHMGELNAIDAEMERRQAIGYVAEALILAAGLFAAAGWIVSQTVKGVHSLESFVTFWAAAAQFRMCLPSIQRHTASAAQMLLHLSDLRSFFDSHPAIAPESGAVPERLSGRIQLRDVSFSYRGGSQPAVRNLNLDINAGETVAIVGPNGAGKTTLVKLLMRLYNVTDGVIRVDSHELGDLNLRRYHEQVAYVGHYPIDFEATVTESIAYGDWQKLIGDAERVQEVAGALGMRQMICDMPDGFDTRLGCRFGDYELSAGQWQKIAIARALARDPAILIMDEPTANLDARYEFELLSALKHLTRERTTIIVSHRLSTLRMAERIIVMDDGQVVDTGRHEELISRDGIYADLYRTQNLAAA